MERHLFSSQPRALARPKYREPSPVEDVTAVFVPSNIMFDKRVMRGTTFRAPTETLSSTAPQASPQPKPKRKVKKEENTLNSLLKNAQVVKKREEVPIHLYLEEQVDAVSTSHIDTQTDAFQEESPRKPYVPAKTGIDTGVQVETEMVFNWEREVLPIVEVVVDKTLEQAVLEVSQETESRKIYLHKQRLQRLDVEDRHRVRQLEQDEMARFKSQVKKQQEEDQRLLREQNVKQKVASLWSARHFLQGLQQDVFDRLQKAHVFYDPLQASVETDFMPWLYERVDHHLTHLDQARRVVDSILGQGMEALVKDRIEAQQKLEQELQLIRLFIHGDGVGDAPIGPVIISHHSTIRDVEHTVGVWLLENRPELARDLGDVVVFNPLSAGRHPPRRRIKFFLNGVPVSRSLRISDINLENLAQLQMKFVLTDSEQEDEEERRRRQQERAADEPDQDGGDNADDDGDVDDDNGDGD